MVDLLALLADPLPWLVAACLWLYWMLWLSVL